MPTVACSGAPSAGTAVTSSTVPCAGSSVTISLTGGSIATGITYQLESSPDNITYTSLGASSGSPQFTVTPTAATYYRIVSTCANSSTSSTSTSVAVSTPGIISFFPYTEDFNSGVVPNCWVNDNTISSTTANLLWKFTGAPGYGTTNNGRPNGSFAWMDASSPYNAVVTLTTPAVDLSSLAVPYVQFDWFKHNSTSSTSTTPPTSPPNNLKLEGYNGTSWVTLFDDTSNAPVWRTERITLPATFSGVTNAQFRFSVDKSLSNDFYDDVLLDDFSIQEAPTCLPPVSPTASNVLGTSATISWTVPTPAPASGYIYEVRTSGLPGSGATGLAGSGNTAAGTTTANVSGLSPVSTYSFYVRSFCGPGDSSVWASGGTFTTACATVTAPYAEGFNTGALPNCWVNDNTIGSTTANLLWRFTGAPGYGATNNGRTAGTYAWVDASSPYNAVVELTSPVIDLSSLSSAYVQFDWFKNNSTSSTTTVPPTYPSNNLKLEGYNGSSWITLFDDTSNANVWRTQNIPLPASFNGVTNAQFRFSVDKQLSNYFYDDVLLDSFEVNGVFCAPPTGVTVSGITATTATINWTAPTPAPANGYEYQVRSGGVVASGATAAGVTAAFVTGLTPLSTDTVYVRSVCASGMYSGWSTGVAFTTPSNCTPPTVQLGNDTTFCAGNSITLNAGNPGATYSWNPGAATTQTLTVSASGTYSVAVTDATGCVGRDTIVVNVVPLPVNLGDDTAVCGSNSIILDAGNPGATYLWSTGATTQTITVNTGGAYFVMVTNANGCVGRDTINITTGASLAVNLGNDTAVCPGAIVTFNAGNPGLSYQWNTGANGQTITVNTAGTYSVSVTNPSGCVGHDTVVVTHKAAPVVNLGNDTTFCSGNSITLNAGNAGATYMWNNGATTRTVVANTSGTYAVLVTNAAGCRGADTINVTVNSTPVVNLGNDTAVCPGTIVTLNAGNPGLSYQWNTGATGQTITVNVAGTYSVAVTSPSGCVGRDTMVVTHLAAPTVNLGNDTAFCSGNSITLNAGNAGATYLWSTGATTRTVVANASGTYIAQVTNAAGCMDADTINVTVNPTPVVNLGNDTTICASAQLVLDAGNPGAAYLWSNGAATQSISVSASGAYNVRVTNASGCIGRDAINVTANPLPVAGAITVTGQSPTYTFSAPGSANATTREWRFGDGTTDASQNPTHTYAANGTYTVTYYVANNCGEDSVKTTVVVGASGVNTVSLEGQVNLFPNPASHFVTVQNTNAQAMKTIQILDVAGATINTIKVTDGAEQRLDISQLASGIYMLRIELEGGAIAVRRLQVK